ncbi:MAG: SDR family oxidoreductase [Pigmentiphaga sp.]|nr:SDR family oxidoreductase [Pigmentiphaga sp.]
MLIDFKGKSAIVTGSTSGIGLAITQGLAAAGARVIVTGRSQATVDKAVERVNAGQPAHPARGVAADLATAQGAQTLIAAQPEADILVNSLGIYEAKPLLELEDADWHRMFDVNVLSAARLSSHYAKGMKQRGWGRLIFVSSESAVNIPTEMVHYGVSKAALQALARGYAKDLAATGVTANSILPGPTATDNVGAFLEPMAAERGISVEEMSARFIQEKRPASLLQRFARPEEVASLAVYVASEQASATTGAALRVEGGIVETPFA